MSGARGEGRIDVTRAALWAAPFLSLPAAFPSSLLTMGGWGERGGGRFGILADLGSSCAAAAVSEPAEASSIYYVWMRASVTGR